MLMPAEGTPPPLGGTPVPVPAYFRHAEPGFSLKRPRGLSRSLPPRPPAKGSIPVSRLFPPRTPGWHQPHARRVSFRDQASEPLQSPGYDPSRPESFFQQSFHRLGRLGHGSYGEVFKVRSKEDGRLYAVKRSMSPFRGPKDRTRKLAEVGGHEKVGQHPRCVRLEQAWEEGGILYLQTELCGPSLQQHCEAWGASLPETQVWGYLRDTLLALAHLHGQGLVHLDVKPANIFLGPRGRCKLGDFGLLVELGASGTSEAQEGDPRYMAPELLQGSYGTAADVFSLGLTILEVACNMELPRGGEGWQRLRQGYLPPEFTAGLSSELRSVLVTMLEPDPKLRATAEALLALPVLRQPRPWSVLWFMAAEALSRGWALWQALLSLLCWLWHGLAHPASWLQPPGPPATPPGSPPCGLLLDRSLSSTWDDDSIGPSLSPEAVLARAASSTSTPCSGSPAPRSRHTPRDALDLSDIDSEPPRGTFPAFEPRNLLSLFEDSLGPS
ncbi:membrane-associated tyrosine- and threonine-specific cdc2-inhibitory kinase [Bos indicus]|uniref:Membrane-associated tyrosine- and threonine-specific cdc2-inhibitory kinase n=3 Tax=Bos TaxID=9903 RepID=F1MKK7_BOVIN|nr:membrane-associated tyrosine- and threonine-specific cdc2-inhibitory kinase [Bos taurus]XP_005224692.1 membrane-associated tyrosine- and threonine-specific cdc2-inhibitory kinase [Bos taurus]XP_010817530.1 membrane-associated tyrosine- and threonine-specific cdc2-inhibitory kinase [Bos taurus]XP_027382951.1 membrane-associated tyrosine- and threonine-specific cdc2-inhibitory kinase isoform X1 [Bos indicus x Bos taurus]XP_027382952.1 membrane-associated tyrosine- and threonine-specific cdc2-i